ncbi:MAG: amine oxidase, partial [Caulobacter sp.]|nr:amine oxidase [Caulobacter sp.]
MTEVDIAIVGAGAAGLGAATRLAGAGASFVVLEAQGRVGGRAHTVRAQGGLPLDLGCGWLHSADRNPLAERFAAQGFTIDKTPPPWGRPSIDLSPADQADFGAAFDAFEARLEAAAQTDRDAPASDFLAPGGRWNPRLNAFSAYYNGAEFDQVSVLDYAAYDDNGVNWRVAEGYGTAVATQADPARLWLDCPVSVVRHDGPRLRLETARGDLSARAAVICV